MPGPGTALPLMSANSYFGFAVESTYATAASVSLFTPVNSPKVTPNVKWLMDSDFRGSPVMNYDNVAGVYAATFDAKSYCYTDVAPGLIRAALGAPDQVASVGASVWSHTLGLANSPNTGSQPSSYTLLNDSVDATYQMVGSRIDSLNISFAADAAVELSHTWKTDQPQAVASVSGLPESVQHLIPAWNCSASIGGVPSYVVESMELDIKRNTTQIYALGSQSPVSNYCGPITVDGKFQLIVQQGETFWANALTRDQQAMQFQLTDPFTGYFLNFNMNNVQLTDPVIDQSKTYVSLDCNFVAIANLVNTAPTAFGYSPILVTVNNNISTSY